MQSRGNITSGTTYTSTVATSTAAACMGSTYTIESGDTCHSVAISQDINTVALLSANNLQAYCANFPTSGSLCIPTSQKCPIYTVTTNDTCSSIALAYNTTWAKIVSWNPDVGQGCSNLTGSHLGYQLCVNTPGYV